MIDWETIEETLQTWFKRATELPVEWAGQAQEDRRRPYAELNVMGTHGIGVDENRAEYDDTQPEGRQIVRTVRGDRQFTLSCKVVSRDGRPSGSAKHYIEMARTSLHQYWARDLFKEAHLSVATIAGSFDQFNPYQDRAENYSVLDIKFNTIATVTDPKDQGTYVETIQVSSDVDGWPDDIELDNEEMP